jgi:hypothetical protein
MVALCPGDDGEIDPTSASHDACQPSIWQGVGGNQILLQERRAARVLALKNRQSTETEQRIGRREDIALFPAPSQSFAQVARGFAICALIERRAVQLSF